MKVLPAILFGAMGTVSVQGDKVIRKARMMKKASKSSNGKSSKGKSSEDNKVFGEPVFTTFAQGFQIGTFPFVKEGPLALSVRCEENEIALEATITNAGSTVLSCYGTSEDEDPFNVDILPGQSFAIVDFWDASSTDNDIDESSVFCSNGFYFGLDGERTAGTSEPGVAFGGIDCHIHGIYFVSSFE